MQRVIDPARRIDMPRGPSGVVLTDGHKIMAWAPNILQRRPAHDCRDRRIAAARFGAGGLVICGSDFWRAAPSTRKH